MNDLADRVVAALKIGVRRVIPLGAGAAGTVSLVELADGPRIVVKRADGLDDDGLLIEARMIALLTDRSSLPVPGVLHASRDMLIMEYREGDSSFDPAAERHAAELLAALHAVRSETGLYGLNSDGLIGPLRQPNAWTSSWVEFWRERRLLHMMCEAARAGRLPTPLRSRLERLSARVGDLIPDNPAPSLIHGDVWSGNVLARASRITAFLDPAPYYAHHEVELAFITMFSTFADPFFDRYAEIAVPPGPEFWRSRRHVYMIFPLLVHVRLFGGAYVAQLDATLGMLGF